jgi:MarR family transcriptional regulator for hemolysin
MRRTTPATIDEEFGFKLVRLARYWRWRLEERLKPVGMTQAKAVTLIFLSRLGDGMLQRELATVLGIEGPTLVRLLDSLEERGLVERREAQNDRRGKTVHLTKRASPVVREVSKIGADLRAEVLRGIPASDLEASIGVFDAVMANTRERI